MDLVLGAIISASGSLGYALPAIIGLESLGVPSPGETALITAAILASEGKLQIWLVLVIGITSAIVGDSIGYELGRHFGREVLTAKGPLQAKRTRAVNAAERFFQKHGSKTIFFARWVTGVRSVAAWLAGIERMPYPTFLLYNVAGAVSWGLTYGLAAYFGGQAVGDSIKTAGTYALIAAAVVLLGWLGWRWRRRRRHDARSDEPGSEKTGATTGSGARPTELGVSETRRPDTPARSGD